MRLSPRRLRSPVGRSRSDEVARDGRQAEGRRDRARARKRYLPTELEFLHGPNFVFRTADTDTIRVGVSRTHKRWRDRSGYGRAAHFGPWARCDFGLREVHGNASTTWCEAARQPPRVVNRTTTSASVPRAARSGRGQEQVRSGTAVRVIQNRTAWIEQSIIRGSQVRDHQRPKGVHGGTPNPPARQVHAKIEYVLRMRRDEIDGTANLDHGRALDAAYSNSNGRASSPRARGGRREPDLRARRGSIQPSKRLASALKLTSTWLM